MAGSQSASQATLETEETEPMATYKEVSVSGFEEFDQAVKENQGKTIFAYFSGSKDAEGKSWCPDCVEGETGTGGCCTALSVGKKAPTKARKWDHRGKDEDLSPVDLQKSMNCPLVSH